MFVGGAAIWSWESGPVAQSVRKQHKRRMKGIKRSCMRECMQG